MSAVETSETQISKLARKLALLNSTEHGGRASLGSVIGRILAEKPELKDRATVVSRIASQETNFVNSLTLEDQLHLLEQEFPSAREENILRKKEISRRDSEKIFALPELEGAARGEVITRFPPEPNGFMHIGHAKAAIIGSEYAKMYEGQFIFRFDDTSPVAEKKEYYEAFLSAFDWLEIKPNKVRNASDDMEKFYQFAEKLIRTNHAFVCTCSQKDIRDARAKGIACIHRSNTTESNLKIWGEMLQRKKRKNEAVLRFLGNMQSKNTTMRDPVLFRIVEDAHPVQGTKYWVWPTYDFDGPVEDSLDGVTHAMRSKEYEQRDELYYAVLAALGLRQPRIVEFSRLSLENTTVSKRSLKRLIEEGKVEGWDDPRLPTIFGLRKRGFQPQAIKEFILSMGVSKAETEPTWDLLESINRKLLDPLARRFFFVPQPMQLEVQGSPEVEVTLRYHPEKDLGERMIHTKGRFWIPLEDSRQMKVGSKVRLIETYNVVINRIEKEGILASRIPDEDFTLLPKLQWVNADGTVPFSVIVTGPLLKGEEFNPESLKKVSGLAEYSAGFLGEGDIIQFVRFGFCRVECKGRAILAHR